MKQFDFPVRIAILQMRSLSDEHNGSKACNDADPCATVRQQVHRISLAAPIGAQVRSEVHTGLYVDQPASVLGCLKLPRNKNRHATSANIITHGVARI